MHFLYSRLRCPAANTALTWVAAALVLVFGLHVLFSGLAAFSNLNYLFSDYGVYTNAIWNLAHGHGFRFLVDQSYLKTHLSYSLALLSPLFHLFDCPRVLIVAQWMFLVGGAVLLLRTCRRLEVPNVLAAAIIAWVVVHPYTQSVFLSEFHGVSAYYLLIPWLTHALLFHRRWAWLPLVMSLGLREDAGLYLPVLLAYLGWFTGRRTGYVLAAISLGYALLAVLVVYPAVNGVSVFETRSAEISASWSAASLSLRLRESFWLVLPLLPVLWLNPKGWRALPAFAGWPWLITMLSGYPRQHGLQFHDAAVIMASLAAALPIALAGPPGRWVPSRVRPAVVLLLTLTLTAHGARGFFLGGARNDPVYTRRGPHGSMLLALAREVPREGLLLANQWLAVYFSLRPEVNTWRYWSPETQVPRLVVCSLAELYGPHTAFLREGLEDGSWGVRARHFPYYVLEQGARTEHHEELLHALAAQRLAVSGMPGHHQENRLLAGHGLVRHWPGERAAYPSTVAHGMPRRLAAGTWDVVFAYRALPPVWPDKTETGWFSLHRPGQDKALASAPIALPPDPSDPRSSHQALRIHLDQAEAIEARVTGACAELWLLHIDYVPWPDPDPAETTTAYR